MAKNDKDMEMFLRNVFKTEFSTQWSVALKNARERIGKLKHLNADFWLTDCETNDNLWADWFLANGYGVENIANTFCSCDITLFGKTTWSQKIEDLISRYFSVEDNEHTESCFWRIDEIHCNELDEVVESLESLDHKLSLLIEKHLVVSHDIDENATLYKVYMGVKGEIIAPKELGNDVFFTSKEDALCWAEENNYPMYAMFTEEYNIDNIYAENGMLKRLGICLVEYKESIKATFTTHCNTNAQCADSQTLFDTIADVSRMAIASICKIMTDNNVESIDFTMDEYGRESWHDDYDKDWVDEHSVWASISYEHFGVENGLQATITEVGLCKDGTLTLTAEDDCGTLYGDSAIIVNAELFVSILERVEIMFGI